jgi:hypothetical protein
MQNTMADQPHKETMKICAKFPQLLTPNQCVTTTQTANEFGIPYTWVQSILKEDFSTHTESEGTGRETDRVTEIVLCTCAPTFVLCIWKEDLMEMRTVVPVELRVFEELLNINLESLLLILR